MSGFFYRLFVLPAPCRILSIKTFLLGSYCRPFWQWRTNSTVPAEYSTCSTVQYLQYIYITQKYITLLSTAKKQFISLTAVDIPSTIVANPGRLLISRPLLLLFLSRCCYYPGRCCFPLNCCYNFPQALLLAPGRCCCPLGRIYYPPGRCCYPPGRHCYPPDRCCYTHGRCFYRPSAVCCVPLGHCCGTDGRCCYLPLAADAILSYPIACYCYPSNCPKHREG